MVRQWNLAVLPPASRVAGGYGYLRPSSVAIYTGAYQGVDLAAAAWPYDPDPEHRGSWALDQPTTAAAELGLVFEPALALPSDVSVQSHVAQVMIVYVGDAVEFVPNSPFTSAPGYPHSAGAPGRLRTLFGLRWAWSSDNEVRITVQTAAILLAIGMVRALR